MMMMGRRRRWLEVKRFCSFILQCLQMMVLIVLLFLRESPLSMFLSSNSPNMVTQFCSGEFCGSKEDMTFYGGQKRTILFWNVVCMVHICPQKYAALMWLWCVFIQCLSCMTSCKWATLSNIYWKNCCIGEIFKVCRKNVKCNFQILIHNSHTGMMVQCTNSLQVWKL